MTRRIKGFTFDSAVSVRDFQLLLESFPDDTKMTGASFDMQNDVDLIFFESEEFEEVHESKIIPRFYPTFKRDDKGNVTLIDNGLKGDKDGKTK